MAEIYAACIFNPRMLSLAPTTLGARLTNFRKTLHDQMVHFYLSEVSVSLADAFILIDTYTPTQSSSQLCSPAG